MMANYSDELTCDMAETYGIFDIKRVPVKLLATLAVGLREDSRVKRAKTGTKYDDSVILTAFIADLLQMLMWSRTKDAQDGIGQPDSILDYYLERERPKKQDDSIVFDSPEDFKRAWAELTRN